jgi:hypothetical protein
MPFNFHHAAESYEGLLKASAYVQAKGFYKGPTSLQQVVVEWIESFVFRLILADGNVSELEKTFYWGMFSKRLTPEEVETRRAAMQLQPGGALPAIEVPHFFDHFIACDRKTGGLLTIKSMEALCTIALCLSEADNVVNEELGIATASPT